MKTYYLTEDLQLKKYKPYKWILITLGLILYSSFVTIKTINKIQLKPIYRPVISNQITVNDTVPALTEQNVYNEILAQNIMFPEIVFKQCMVESGNLKSNIAIENNNLFGLRVYPNSDTTYAIARNRGHLAFKDWRDSVKEYARLQKRNFKPKYYYLFLKESNYAESPTYIQKLQDMK
jgi:uncharacterized FlgJ-related protein